MNVRYQSIGILGHRGDQAACHLGRFDAGQPNPKVAGQFTEMANEIRQSRPLLAWFVAVPIDPVMAKVYPGQHDFAVTGIGQPADFINDMLEWS